MHIVPCTVNSRATFSTSSGDGAAPLARCRRRPACFRTTETATVHRRRPTRRDGTRGVQTLNQHCELLVRTTIAGLPSPPAGPWYPGRPVMVLRNDYIVKLFNGDVGIALPDEHGDLQVFFPRPDNTFRAVAPARLPEHETAFAIIVHKSQGSEFDRVVVVLPEHHSAVATRELLYTAATRARRQVTLCGSAAALERAVSTPTRRHSGLVARLRQNQSARTAAMEPPVD